MPQKKQQTNKKHVHEISQNTESMLFDVGMRGRRSLVSILTNQHPARPTTEPSGDGANISTGGATSVSRDRKPEKPARGDTAGRQLVPGNVRYVVPPSTTHPPTASAQTTSRLLTALTAPSLGREANEPPEATTASWFPEHPEHAQRKPVLPATANRKSDQNESRDKNCDPEVLEIVGKNSPRTLAENSRARDKETAKKRERPNHRKSRSVRSRGARTWFVSSNGQDSGSCGTTPNLACFTFRGVWDQLQLGTNYTRSVTISTDKNLEITGTVEVNQESPLVVRIVTNSINPLHLGLKSAVFSGVFLEIHNADFSLAAEDSIFQSAGLRIRSNRNQQHQTVSIERCLFNGTLNDLNGIRIDSTTGVSVVATNFSNIHGNQESLVFGVKCARSELVMDHVTFMGNSVGGVSTDNCSVSMTASYFEDNTPATNVELLNSEANISDSVFIGNSHGRGGGKKGGAMFLQNSRVEVVDCNFTRNAANDGGAIYAERSTLRILHCAFTENTSAGSGTMNVDLLNPGGGALSAVQSNVSILWSRLQGNKAKHGGGVALSESIFKLISSTINSNMAENSAGAMYIRTSVVNMLRSHMEHNVALAQGGFGGGGALLCTGGHPHSVTIIDSRVCHNIAHRDGWGGIRNSGCPISIIGSRVSQNEADGNGGGIQSRGETRVVLKNSTLNHNTAHESGGAMTGGPISIEDCNIFFNSARKQGGAILLEYTGAYSLSVLNSQFRNNSASESGGVLVSEESTVSFHNCTLEGNAAVRGGVGYCQKCRVSIKDNSVEYNAASGGRGDPDEEGGGVFYISNSATLSVSGSSLNYNSATRSGGVFRANDNSDITITKCSLTNNMADKDGGVVALTYNGTLTIGNSHLVSNTCTIKGGVIKAYFGVILHLNNSTFLENKAETASGGVMFVEKRCALFSHNSRFQDNWSVSNGGAAYVVDHSSYNDTGSFFRGNIAHDTGRLANPEAWPLWPFTVSMRMRDFIRLYLSH